MSVALRPSSSGSGRRRVAHRATKPRPPPPLLAPSPHRSVQSNLVSFSSHLQWTSRRRYLPISGQATLRIRHPHSNKRSPRHQTRSRHSPTTPLFTRCTGLSSGEALIAAPTPDHHPPRFPAKRLPLRNLASHQHPTVSSMAPLGRRRLGLRQSQQ